MCKYIFEEKIDNRLEEKEIINKLLNLSLLYEYENSKHWIGLVSHQIKGYEIQKQKFSG